MTEALKASDALSAAVAVAPRVTIEMLTAAIADTTFLRHDTLTLCVLTMRNGFKIVGEAACASPESFNAALGEKYAYEDAVRKAWGYEGYALRERLAGRS